MKNNQRPLEELFLSLCVLLGNENEEFIFAFVDQVEWSDPKYCHQN